MERYENRLVKLHASGNKVMVNKSVDIGTVLDSGPFSPLQRWVLLLASLSIVFDGFDGQLASFAIPVLIKEWNVTREDFAGVVAAGLLGMAIGSAIGGYLGDLIGRRRAIIGAVGVFSIGTMAMGFAQDLNSLIWLRFLAGLGVGGALPTCTTLAAEYTPFRWRTIAVTLTIVFVPVGGMLAGLFSGTIIPLLGWRYLFFIGGALPLLLTLVLIVSLPESPSWLAHRPTRWVELQQLLARMSRPLEGSPTFRDAETQSDIGEKPGFRSLFSEGRAWSTTLLWIIFFMSLMAVYTAFSWLPTLLSEEGHSVEVATRGLTAYNLGGVLGALTCALVISRFGSRWPMVLFMGLGFATALLLSHWSADLSPSLLIFLIGTHGLAVIAVQCTLYALCAFTYPTKIRATGTASALTFGRLGAILSAFVGAGVIGASGGLSGAFGILAFAMAIGLLALALFPRHIPPAR